MSTSQVSVWDRLAKWAAFLYAADRILRVVAVEHFVRRPHPPVPGAWPTVAILQPVTRGASSLREALQTRMKLDYPGDLNHILICDASDVESQAVCQEITQQCPHHSVRIVQVQANRGEVASKIEKLQGGLAYAKAEVLFFVDDDVLVRPGALRQLVPYLFARRAGVAFGVGCYINWRTPWSSILSSAVNSTALLSYIPLTYLVDPFAISGHCYAIQRSVFERVGGFRGMETNVYEHLELVRRLRLAGLRVVQATWIYDVDNQIESLMALRTQIRRWSILTRQCVQPLLTPQEHAASVLVVGGSLVPAELLFLALLTRRPAAARSLAFALVVFCTVNFFCEFRYLGRHTPLRRLILALVSVLAVPYYVCWRLIANGEVEWRGQRLRARRGGEFHVVG